MTISTHAISQSMQYQQSLTTSRQTTMSLNKVPANQPKESALDSPTSNTMLSSAITSALNVNMSASMSQTFTEQAKETEQKILSEPSDDKDSRLIKLLLAKLIKFLNGDDKEKLVDMLEADNNLATNIAPPKHQPVVEYVEIDGQQFPSNAQLLVTETVNFSQSLSYSMQGEFSDGNNNFSVDFSFALQSSYSASSSFSISAQELKDPLLVQFGSRGLGNIIGVSEFDLSGDESPEQLAQFSGDVGYLVFDKNGNGKADNGSELFGPKTNNGFAELRQLDDNGDNFISIDDSAYQQLYLWQPHNDHWQSLSQAQVKAIYSQAIATPFSFIDQQGETQAQLRYSSFALDNDNNAKAVHQIDIAV